MNQTDIIAQLQDDIRHCRLCRDNPRYLPGLPHEPNPVAVLSANAKIAIAGQAPGIRVHNTSLPFNDPSGDRLRQWLGVDRETFYNQNNFAIIPMGFCFPGYDKHKADLPPRRECAPHWHAQVFAAMPQLTLIIAIGAYAQKYHLGEKFTGNMTSTVAHWQDYINTVNHNGHFVMPVPHPSWRNNSWLKKNPFFENQCLPVLRQKVAELLKASKNDNKIS